MSSELEQSSMPANAMREHEWLKTQIDYHRGRAAKEMDKGLRTPSLAAARAHLRLSALHAERVSRLSGRRLLHPPLLEM